MVLKGAEMYKVIIVYCVLKESIKWNTHHSAKPSGIHSMLMAEWSANPDSADSLKHKMANDLANERRKISAWKENIYVH